jgi:hypothetical protein
MTNGYKGNGVSNGSAYSSSFVQKYSTTEDTGGSIDYFDDVVEFRTKWQLDPTYAYSPSATPCP